MIIFKLVIQNGGLGTHCEIILKWMPQDLTDDNWTMVEVMGWCHQATSHYLSQCWPRCDGWGIHSKIAIRWRPLDLTEKSTLVQVMAWCHKKLTCGQVMHICISKWGHHWFTQWLVACWRAMFKKHVWQLKNFHKKLENFCLTIFANTKLLSEQLIAKCTISHKLQWDFNQHTIFMKEN